MPGQWQKSFLEVRERAVMLWLKALCSVWGYRWPWCSLGFPHRWATQYSALEASWSVKDLELLSGYRIPCNSADSYLTHLM